jgi:hypothetical protein
MRLHLVLDRRTGEVKAQGRSGRLYSPQEIERAERAGDRALLDDLPCEETLDAASILHDCPECRAAIERGEKPIVLEGAQLEAALAQAMRGGNGWRRRKRR